MFGTLRQQHAQLVRRLLQRLQAEQHGGVTRGLLPGQQLAALFRLPWQRIGKALAHRRQRQAILAKHMLLLHLTGGLVPDRDLARVQRIHLLVGRLLRVRRGGAGIGLAHGSIRCLSRHVQAYVA